MIIQLFIHIFLFFSLQPHLPYALQSNTRFEFNLKNFSGVLRRGDNTKVVHELKKHLRYLGYLDPNNIEKKNNFDKHLENAIKKYQKFYSLNITGAADINTMTSIHKPRCGVPDFVNPRSHPKSLYVFLPGDRKWRKKKLKYHMTKTVIDAYRQPIEQAVQEWQSLTPFTFTNVSNRFFNRADIKVSFETGDHGDGFPFSPNGRVIAHAFRPPKARVHFNAGVRWTSDGDRSANDIKTTALHEFGHVLGLGHSTVPQSIMFPGVGLGERKNLHQDDIDGINNLYGFNKLATVEQAFK